MQLANRVALVTGGGSGIGEAAAKLLAKQGAKVAVLDHKMENAARSADYINQNGGEALPLAADISQPELMEKAVRQIVDKWGALHIVFANAGINGVWAPIEELKPEEWEKTISTNLSGTFYTIKYAVPYLKKSGGSVIITASVNGTRIFSNTGATAYSCTKAGQVAMAKMLALELAQSKVRVNVICPGAIDTNIDQNTEKRNTEEVQVPVEYPEGSQPLEGGAGSAEQVAQLVLFLASDASNHITGTEIWIDGAESLLRG
jgi:NAD(P)-dependent dehydrogenase (short-subunit alcohol dehydrogenase family)